MTKKCTGRNCTAINGIGHSAECKAEYEECCALGAGERHPECRYRGYKGEPLQDGATEDQKAAWDIGKKARQ